METTGESGEGVVYILGERSIETKRSSLGWTTYVPKDHCGLERSSDGTYDVPVNCRGGPTS